MSVLKKPRKSAKPRKTSLASLTKNLTDLAKMVHASRQVDPRFALPADLYGVPADYPDIQWENVDPWNVEMICFRDGRTVEQGGLGKHAHLKRAIKMSCPDLEWSDWLDDQLWSLCGDDNVIRRGESTLRFVTWTGCASAGKTFCAGMFAWFWWLAMPFDSVAILTSTTVGMVRKRIWPIIQHFHATTVMPNGRRLSESLTFMLDSKTTLRWEKGDEKHAIFAKAVAFGETQKALQDLKGIHAPRILLVIDEANGTPEAIFETVTNLRKGCQDITVLAIGNPVSHLDPHGLCAEPLAGWNSISINSESWPTKGVPKWGIEQGVCLHFDGSKSPNVVKGKTIYPYLYTLEDYQAAVERKGETSISFWSQDRGFWPPEGFCNTVLSEPMINKYGGIGRFDYLSSPQKMAALDSGFGGDLCIVQFATLGRISNGSYGIQLEEHLEIRGDAESPDELDYQIARRFIDECRHRGIDPRCTIVDATGTGRGVAAILHQEWSDTVVGCEFGGSPSLLPASTTDPRPAADVYASKVTELWYSVREFLIAGQLRGLYKEAIIEFCTRQYTYKAKKLIVEPKDECKQKLGFSPDHADACAMLVELARRLGAEAGIRVASTSANEWNKGVRLMHSVYENAEESDSVAATGLMLKYAPDFSM